MSPRRHRWLWALGVFVLAIAALLIYREVSMSPAEKRVRAYLTAARGRADAGGTITGALSANEIPVLLDIMAITNSPVRLWLMDYERRVELALPDKAFRWVLNATDATRDYGLAATALQALARTAGGPEALAPYLKHPDRNLHSWVIFALENSDASSAALLTQALAGESDPAHRSSLARHILARDPTNELALAVQRAANGPFRVRYGPKR